MKPHRLPAVPIRRRVLAALAVAAGLVAAAAGVQAESAAQRERFERRAENLQRELDRQRAADDAQRDELRRRAEAQDHHLASLHQRLQQCGSCAERTALEAEIRQIEEGRKQALRVFCSSFGALEWLNPAAVGLAAQMAQQPQICGGADDAEFQRIRRANDAARQRLQEQARSGRPEDGYKLAEWMREIERDISTACNLYAAASDKGHPPATVALATRCLIASGGAANIRRGEQLLQQCAEQGHQVCVDARDLQQRLQDAREAAARPRMSAEQLHQMSARRQQREVHARQQRCQDLREQVQTLEQRLAGTEQPFRQRTLRRQIERFQRQQAEVC
ncbi:MAG: hypothetical protein QM750_27960 [Rubrivivax sp.]